MGEGRARIAASILNSNLGNLAYEVRRVIRAGADRIHLDVMDAHFVPNLTFGASTIGALRPTTKAPFDAHLMIAEPGRWLDGFLAAGCDSITIHVEISEPIEPTLRRIRAAGRAAGLALRPATPLAALEPYRDLLDIVMVMTVEPGFGGQTFMRDVALEKVLPARDLLSHKPWGGEVHVDGGVNRETAELVGGLGADVLVVGSALFTPGRDQAREVRLVRALADEGFAHDRNGGVPPRPRDEMVRFAQLPRHLAAPLRDAIERSDVPVVMVRGDGEINPDGVRDYDLLVPWSAEAWVTDHFADARAVADKEAATWRARLRAEAGRALPPGPPDPCERSCSASAGRRYGSPTSASGPSGVGCSCWSGSRRTMTRRPPTRSPAGSSSCGSTRTPTAARTSPLPRSVGPSWRSASSPSTPTRAGGADRASPGRHPRATPRRSISVSAAPSRRPARRGARAVRRRDGGRAGQ